MTVLPQPDLKFFQYLLYQPNQFTDVLAQAFGGYTVLDTFPGTYEMPLLLTGILPYPIEVHFPHLSDALESVRKVIPTSQEKEVLQYIQATKDMMDCKYKNLFPKRDPHADALISDLTLARSVFSEDNKSATQQDMKITMAAFAVGKLAQFVTYQMRRKVASGGKVLQYNHPRWYGMAGKKVSKQTDELSIGFELNDFVLIEPLCEAMGAIHILKDIKAGEIDTQRKSYKNSLAITTAAIEKKERFETARGEKAIRAKKEKNASAREFAIAEYRRMRKDSPHKSAEWAVHHITDKLKKQGIVIHQYKVKDGYKRDLKPLVRDWLKNAEKQDPSLKKVSKTPHTKKSA